MHSNSGERLTDDRVFAHGLRDAGLIFPIRNPYLSAKRSPGLLFYKEYNLPYGLGIGLERVVGTGNYLVSFETALGEGIDGRMFAMGWLPTPDLENPDNRIHGREIILAVMPPSVGDRRNSLVLDLEHREPNSRLYLPSRPWVQEDFKYLNSEGAVDTLFESIIYAANSNGRAFDAWVGFLEENKDQLPISAIVAIEEAIADS